MKKKQEAKMKKVTAALAAFLTLAGSASAADKQFKTDFNDVKFVEDTRTIKRVVKKSGKDEGVVIIGKAKIVEGRKGGNAIDVSDGRGRVEMHIETGDYYNQFTGSIGFWISPKKKLFGVKDAEKTYIFKESNKEGDSIGLYFDKNGTLVGEIVHWVPKEAEVTGPKTLTEEEIKAKLGKVIKVKEKEKDKLEQATEKLKNKEDAAADAKKPKEVLKTFTFFGTADKTIKNWKNGEWYHVAFSWDFKIGRYSIFINGEFVGSGVVAEKFKRKKFGKSIKFAPTNNGFAGVIDDVKVKPNSTAAGFEVDEF